MMASKYVVTFKEQKNNPYLVSIQTIKDKGETPMLNAVNYKIGVTERGDGGIDLSWKNKLDTVAGAVIITKCITNPALHDALIENKDRLILNAGITGNGGSVYEPNIRPWSESLDALETLIQKGFPADHIVLRCDPIILTPDCWARTEAMLYSFLKRNLGIKRVRISILDNYPHVKTRFEEKGLPILYNGYFHAHPKTFEWLAKKMEHIFINHPDIAIECCAEPKLLEAAAKTTRPIELTGCVGLKDAAILGIQLPDSLTRNPQHRNGCACLSVKTELLTNPKPCPHGCIYCYWKG